MYFWFWSYTRSKLLSHFHYWWNSPWTSYSSFFCATSAASTFWILQISWLNISRLFSLFSAASPYLKCNKTWLSSGESVYKGEIMRTFDLEGIKTNFPVSLPVSFVNFRKMKVSATAEKKYKKWELSFSKKVLINLNS